MANPVTPDGRDSQDAGDHVDQPAAPAAPWIVVAGTDADGLAHYGPFARWDAARQWAERHTDAGYWLATLCPPGDVAAATGPGEGRPR